MTGFVFGLPDEVAALKNTWQRSADISYRRAGQLLRDKDEPWANLLEHRLEESEQRAQLVYYRRHQIRPAALARRLAPLLADTLHPQPVALPSGSPAGLPVAGKGTGDATGKRVAHRREQPGTSPSSVTASPSLAVVTFGRTQARHRLQRAEQLGREAEDLLQKQQIAAARQKLLGAIELAPESAALRILLGRVQARLGDRSGALRTASWLERTGRTAAAEALRDQLRADERRR